MTGLKRGDRVELPATQGEVTQVYDTGWVAVTFDGASARCDLPRVVAKSLVRVKPPFQPREGGIYQFGGLPPLVFDGKGWHHIGGLPFAYNPDWRTGFGEPVELKLVPVTE